MLRKILLLASLSGLLAGCALPGSESAPTPYPSNYLPTVIYLTAQSINGTMSAQTAAAITPTKTPTLTETRTPTPSATATQTKASPTPRAPNHIVISEFRTTGPLGTNDEFVELYNPTGAPVNIGNWSIVVSSPCGSSLSTLINI